jgi:hypothetical protein
MTPASVQAVTELLGAGSAILFGNRDGTLWTDLTQPVDGPPTLETTRYRRGGVGRLVAVQALDRTPFVFGIDLPESQVLAPVRSLAWKLVAVGAVILAIGRVAGWRSNSRLVHPLADLTVAAEAIAEGRTPPMREAVTRRDELGRLGDRSRSWRTTSAMRGRTSKVRSPSEPERWRRRRPRW